MAYPSPVSEQGINNHMWRFYANQINTNGKTHEMEKKIL